MLFCNKTREINDPVFRINEKHLEKPNNTHSTTPGVYHSHPLKTLSSENWSSEKMNHFRQFCSFQ